MWALRLALELKPDGPHFTSYRHQLKANSGRKLGLPLDRAWWLQAFYDFIYVDTDRLRGLQPICMSPKHAC